MLKVICKACGHTILETVHIDDIEEVFQKPCPGCGRRIAHEDRQRMQIQISGIRRTKPEDLSRPQGKPKALTPRVPLAPIPMSSPQQEKFAQLYAEDEEVEEEDCTYDYAEQCEHPDLKLMDMCFVCPVYEEKCPHAP